LTISAFLDLYQTTFDKTWIDRSETLAQYTIAHFFNEETKMFDYTSDLDPALIAKKAEYEDNVIPSSNSAMARSLFALGTLTYNNDYLDRAEQMLRNMMPRITAGEYITYYSNWFQLLLDHLVSPYEIAIVGEDAIQKKKEISKNYIGNSLILGTERDENMELLKDKKQEGVTMIYVCQNKTCKLPVTDAQDAFNLIDHKIQ
jgi:uncharacterized protein YyaL (SSP411 family)